MERPDILRAVRLARLEFCLTGLPLSQTVSVTLGTLSVLILYHAVRPALLLAWLCCLIGISVNRVVVQRSFHARKDLADADLGRYERRILIGALMSGCAWGSTSLLFLPLTSELEFFLAFVIAGVCSGALTTLWVFPAAVDAFVLPAVLLLAGRFVLEGGALHVVMGVMGGVYALAIAAMSRRSDAQLRALVLARAETQRSRAALASSEEQRQASDAHLRMAAESGQIGVWSEDPISGRTLWDERMYELYQLQPDPDCDPWEGWRLRVHPADLPRVEAEFAAARAGQGDFRSEFRLLLPEGQERTIKAAAAIMRDAAGVPTWITGVNLDITELRRLERVKSEFVAVVSHELRTPLTSIMGSLGLVANDAAGALPPAARELLQVALRNGERLQSLIEDLLDVERLESGRLRFNLQPHPLQPLLQQSVAANGPYAARFGVSLALQGPSAPVQVVVDSGRLMQVLANLISNAVKFSPSGGCVELGAQYAGDRVRITVRDHGPGVPRNFRSRIFGKFSQGDTSDSRQRGGAGLGLAISKALVEQMGGCIGFEDAPGGGTAFFFELPVPGPGQASSAALGG